MRVVEKEENCVASLLDWLDREVVNTLQLICQVDECGLQPGS